MLKELKFNFISFYSWLWPQNRVLRQREKKKKEQKNERRKSCPSGSDLSCCPHQCCLSTFMKREHRRKKRKEREHRTLFWLARVYKTGKSSTNTPFLENTHKAASIVSQVWSEFQKSLQASLFYYNPHSYFSRMTTGESLIFYLNYDVLANGM